jgi:hypothetical protein
VSKHISVSVSAELWDELRREAEREGVNATFIVRRLLEDWLVAPPAERPILLYQNYHRKFKKG